MHDTQISDGKRAPTWLDIEDFYERFAHEYCCIADDRDFASQASALSTLVKASEAIPPTVMEIFAGPAKHAQALMAQGWGAAALDISSHMKEVACSQGFPDRGYHLLDIAAPHFPEPGERYDLCIAMRYSIGYISRRNLPQMFRNIRTLLKPGGILAIECHRLSTITTMVDRLSIRERVGRRPDGSTIRCRWPDSPIQWSPRSWVATMTVTLSIDRPGEACPQEYAFLSREEIHSADFLSDLAADAGFRNAPPGDLARHFQESELVVLESAR